MSCGENIDRFACRKEWSTHALTLPCARATLFLTRNVLKKITWRSAYAMCFFCETSLSLAFQLTRPHSWEEDHAEDDEVCGWSGSTRRASGTTLTKSGEFASTLFAKRPGLCRKIFCRGCTHKSGKHWGHFKLPTTKCTPKDRSSSQGSRDEIHKPCFLLKIVSPILPKHPATWHEVGHPSGQDMAEKFLDLSNLLAYRFFWFLHFPSSKQTSKHTIYK